MISEYGSAENVIANSGKLNGKLKDTIKDNSDKILLSKELATIRQDVPIELDEKQLEIGKPDYNALYLLYEELEFKTFAAKISSRAVSAPNIPTQMAEKTPLSQVVNQQPTLFDTGDAGLFPVSSFLTIDETDHNYILVTDRDNLKRVVDIALSQKEICIDTETTDIDPLEAAIVAISFHGKKGAAILSISDQMMIPLKNLKYCGPFLKTIIFLSRTKH